MAKVLDDSWIRILVGDDPKARRYVRRAYAKYRRELELRDAKPWTDLGGEG